MRKILLITGKPGSGKTTLFRRVVSSLPRPAVGFYTQEIRQEGIRQGFELVTLDGQRGILAHVNLRHPPRIGKYGVDLGALERLAVPLLLKTNAEGGLAVIDEIGPMEILSTPFRQAVLALLNGPASLIATIVLRSTPFTDLVKSTPGAILLEIDPGNREKLIDQIMAIMQEP
jgi:nucleoside-triphosphatase